MQIDNFRGAVKFIKNFELSKQLFLMILLAFIFSVVIRLYWVYWGSNFPEFFWNNQFMISTNDGYAFAEGARDMLQGFHEPNDLSYYGSSLSTLTAFLVRILPFEFETIIFYMSVFFSSLIVIPILLISSELKCIRAGFIGALVATAANSYYNRTMVGYYDTDMLNIVFPMFILWAMIRICIKKDSLCLLYIPFFILIYDWWYPSSFSLNSMMAATFFIYTFIFQKKRIINYEAVILIILSLSNIPVLLKVVFIVFLFFIFYFKKDTVSLKILCIIGIIVFGIFVIRGGLNPILFQLKFYIFRNISDSGETVYKFFNVNQTIQESGIVSYDVFMRRISSSIIVFIVASIGYVVLCFRHKEFLLSLPILILGFLALKAGLRFTIYAVAVMGLGFGYGIYYGVKLMKIPRSLQRLLLLLMTMAALYPAWQHIKEYKTHSVFYNSEVSILDDLKDIAQREDYVLAWWDYGYPIRYYCDVKTLIDGGKHLGSDNFPVSFALFKDQVSSANMARLDVEYTERQFKEKFGLNIKQMLKDYNQNDIDDFLISLSLKDFKLPKPTRDIYYYLPDRMMNIFSVVSQFSNLDLKDGKSYEEPFYHVAYVYGQNSNGINLGNGIVLSNDLTSLKFQNQSISINTFYETKYDANAKLNINEIKIDSNAKIYAIFMKDYGRFVILDEKALNSTYVQLYILEKYDKDLFEPVILSPSAKVYKLKR